MINLSLKYQHTSYPLLTHIYFYILFLSNFIQFGFVGGELGVGIFEVWFNWIKKEYFIVSNGQKSEQLPTT